MGERRRQCNDRGLPMALFKQIARGKLANKLMIRRHRGQAHSAVAGVDQHTGFVHFSRQLMNVFIVDTDQQRGFRLLHLVDKQRGIAFHFFQRTVAQPHIVRFNGFANPLDHLVIKDIRADIEGTRWRKYHQVIKQQPTMLKIIQYALLLGDA
jgi:hypothetical protein